jgi:hypothetical protein
MILVKKYVFFFRWFGGEDDTGLAQQPGRAEAGHDDVDGGARSLW